MARKQGIPTTSSRSTSMKHHHDHHILSSGESNDKLGDWKARVEAPQNQIRRKRESSEASKEGSSTSSGITTTCVEVPQQHEKHTLEEDIAEHVNLNVLYRFLSMLQIHIHKHALAMRYFYSMELLVAQIPINCLVRNIVDIFYNNYKYPTYSSIKFRFFYF